MERLKFKKAYQIGLSVVELCVPQANGYWCIAYACLGDDPETVWLCECKRDLGGEQFEVENAHHRFPALGKPGEVTVLSQGIALNGADSEYPHPRSWMGWVPKRFSSLESARAYSRSFVRERNWRAIDCGTLE